MPHMHTERHKHAHKQPHTHTHMHVHARMHAQAHNPSGRDGLLFVSVFRAAEGQFKGSVSPLELYR